MKRTDGQDPAFRDLVALLDADLRRIDGEDHAFYSQFNRLDSLHHALVGLDRNIPVACGAFRIYDEKTVEIKRMFVLPAFRGCGTGSKILEELEAWALELNFSSCILETGKQMIGAIRLYRKAGYSVIENYGQYALVDNSVCMKKIISPGN